MKIFFSVKHQVVPTLPKGPTDSRNAYTNPSFGLLINPIQPIAEHIGNIRRGRNIVGTKNHTPN
jgi:hypothetical protein